MRDRLTHDYFGAALWLVWRVVERDLQGLRTEVDALLADALPAVADAPGD